MRVVLAAIILMKYDIYTLKVFLSVAQEGSIAKAAAKEHTVPSAISKRISELEKSIGTELLYRHRRGVMLTQAGGELQQHATRILDELSSLDSTLSNYANGVKGQVRLVANTSAIVQFLPDDLSSFLKQHPTVKIDLEEHTSEEVQKLISSGFADLGIMVAQRPLDGLESCLYKSDELMVIMPRSHPLGKRSTLRFSETLEYDYVGLPRGSSLCNSMVIAARDLGVPLKLRIQATSFDGLRRMVSRGLGIGVLPKGSVLPFLETEKLVARPLAEPWASRDLLLVTKPTDSLTLLSRLLYEHLASKSVG